MIVYGDNLAALREMAGSSVDLVYADPPFNSGKDYGDFDDRWPSDGDYLSFMRARLAALHRVLRPTGSIYLHCDTKMSHRLRVELDEVFGAGNFRNEVVWRYRRWPTRARCFQRMHDVLLLYTKSNDYTLHTLYGYEQLAASTRRTFGDRKQRADFSSGRRRPGVEATKSQGPPLSDVWEVGVLAPVAKERTGYPTQKPERLLERVILASSNPGDVVLDPFCGSGTALAVAEKHGRRAIGIDSSPRAVEIARERLALAETGVAIGSP